MTILYENDKLRLSETKDTVFIDFKNKLKCIVVSDNEKFRKGIEIAVCDDCETLETITMYERNKKYCEVCAIKSIRK